MTKALQRQEIDIKARKHFPKNNFFCYRWRVVDEFSKAVDREMYQMQLNGGAFHQSLVNERIMALYKMGYRKTKNDFMSQITQSAMVFLQGRRTALSKAVQDESMYTSSMKEMVETMFNILLSCSIELNTVLGFSELFVAATEPEIVTFQSGSTTKISSLRARLSSSMYSLLIHGQKDKILFYILPVEDLIGLSPSVNGYEPIKVIQAHIEEGAVIWEIDGKKVNEDSLEDACLRALHALIQATEQVLSQMQIA